MAEGGGYDSLGAFAAALGASPALPPGIAARPGADLAHRFAVYRNNVAVGLIEALRAGFPVTERLVGAAFFRVMAREYAADNRPRTPMLFEYGRTFPAFVAGFAPADPVPYLADVAALEAMRTAAHHAADAPAWSPAGLARFLTETPPEAWLAHRLPAHPAARVVASAHPAATIWAAHQSAAETPGPVSDWRPETALVTRPGDRVLVRAVDPASGLFAAALLDGAAIGAAGARALARDPAFDIGGTLVAMAQAGALTAPRGE